MLLYAHSTLMLMYHGRSKRYATLLLLHACVRQHCQICIGMLLNAKRALRCNANSIHCLPSLDCNLCGNFCLFQILAFTRSVFVIFRLEFLKAKTAQCRNTKFICPDYSCSLFSDLTIRFNRIFLFFSWH